MKFAAVRQKDSMQCGVAALAMVCRHFGQPYSIGFLERYCHPTVDGVSLKGIRDAAEALGLETVSAKISVRNLAEAPLPAILHWNQNHFVVLYKVRKGKFYVADPAKGHIVYTRDEFLSHWLPGGLPKEEYIDSSVGIAMFFGTTGKFGTVKDDTPARKTFSSLFKLMAEHKRSFTWVLFTMLAGCLLQFIFPFLTQQIVDSGINNRNIGIIWLILLGELMIVVGRTVTDFIRRWILLKVSMRVNISVVSDFFMKLLKLPMSFFDTKLMGDIMQRIGDHSRLQSFMTGQLLGMTFSILTFLVFGAVLLYYDAVVFAIFMAGSVVYGIWIASFLAKRKVLDYSMFECQAKNQQTVFRLVTTMQEIKLQGCEQRRCGEWRTTQDNLFDVQIKALKLQQTQEAGSVFINEIKNILITVFAASAVIDGTLTLGAMLAIQYIVGQLNSPVEQIMAFINSLQDVRISLDRINEIHYRRDEDPASGLTAFGEGRDIVFKDVSFRYDLHSPELTLENINLTIPEGKTTAIVGASGSGKTTLLKLILGYYSPEKGEITVAGNPLGSYSLKWWREQCGTVMQDGVVFSESIKRNIAAKDGEVDEERLGEAAGIACIDGYVATLPLKYDTKIGPDGNGTSQGQKQRLLIARAVYRNPGFLFFDEATNSLDTANEKAITDNLKIFCKGKTVVTIAHRLSTVKDADNIIVLEKGRIAEQGTHEELIGRKGRYFDLIRNQLELGA